MGLLNLSGVYPTTYDCTMTHNDAPAPEKPRVDPAGPRAYGGTPWRVSYTIEEVATATGVSRRTVAYALERGDLQARYPSSRPVILHKDLVAWIEGAPTHRTRAPRRTAKAVA